MRRRTHILLIAGLIATGAALGGGCQERVVGTDDGFSGSQYRPEPSPQQDKGVAESLGDGLRNTGDFLFGWTGLTGDNRQRSRVGESRDIEPSHRLGQPSPISD